MTQHGHGDHAAGGEAASMPAPIERDPRMPRLAQSPGFTDFMRTGWSEPDRTPVLPGGAALAAHHHRTRLAAELVGKTIAIAAGRAPVRANDTTYEFRAHSDFLWLVGCGIEDAVLVIASIPGGYDATLYLPAPARPGDDAFHADPLRGELWVGPMPGLAEYAAALDVRTRPIEALVLPRDALIAGATAPAGAAVAALDGRARSVELDRALSELRMFKDDWELAELAAAVASTEAGFTAVAREIPSAVEWGGERWLQGTFDRYARTVGNGPGYATIVGSGAHAPVLHWVRADGAIRPDELLLLDMGVERRSGFTADVTRTIPTSGRFTDVQRAVHDLVEASHRAGLGAVGPGRLWSDFHAASMEVLARGLHDWGMLPVSVDEALSPDGQQHRRYIVCGVGHHLGLDVHDCASSSYAAYQAATMHAGMALTVEPGLYFHSFDETIPPELRGIGVRIEDDLVVTDTGHDVISNGLPIDATGLESWLRDARVGEPHATEASALSNA